MRWLLLSIGIAIEILATSSLKLSDGFTKLGYAGLTLFCFGLAFYIMSLVVRTMPVGIAYSVWAGVASRASRLSVLWRSARSWTALPISESV